MNIVIFGNSEIAEVVDFYLAHDSKFKVKAFTVDGSFIKGHKFCGKPVVPFEELKKKFPPSKYKMLIAIGYSDFNEIRERKYLEAKAHGYNFITYLSSKATVWKKGNSIGENSIIFEDNTIQPFTKVGNNVIMWSGNHLGHHSVIEDHCFVSSHVVISGGVKVGRNSFLGVNATIRDHIEIGNHNVVGMGAKISKSTPAYAISKESETSFKIKG